jgi:hypothetical protein
MARRALKSEIALPPGLLSRAVVRELLRLILEEFRWFVPARYGGPALDHVFLRGAIGVEAMLDHYEDWNYLYVAATTDRDYIAIEPSKLEESYPYTGGVTWTTSGSLASRPTWRTAHEVQVKQLMKLLGSPLAYTALRDDIESKTRGLVPEESWLKQVITVRDYSEGLAGLYWRNFFGPPFARMFGERLHALPPEHRRDLGDGVVLVEPYPLPGDADTDEGRSRERALIEQLGPECFYDHERHVLPTRRPELPAPGAWT